MAGDRQIFLDQTLRQRLNRDKPDLAALALDLKLQYALTALDVLNAQPAELLAADAVIEEGGQYRPAAKPRTTRKPTPCRTQLIGMNAMPTR